MNEAATAAHKQAALEFLQSVVAGHIEEAYLKHVDMGGRHHNPFFPAGFPALQKAMAENHAQFPHKELFVINVLGDADLVAVHSHLIPRPGESGMTVVHVFRFSHGKIVEMWDCGQAIPGGSPNKDGAF